jgi:hypothetical protein
MELSENLASSSQKRGFRGFLEDFEPHKDLSDLQYMFNYYER